MSFSSYPQSASALVSLAAQTEIQVAAKARRVMITTLERSNRRDAYPPVNRLPPEILGKIFTILVESHLIERFSRYREADSPDKVYGWLSVLKTCQHWRETALSNPQVWSYVYIAHPSACTPEDESFLSLQLERSQSASLTIIQPSYNCSLYRPLLESQRNAVFSNINRARTLVVALDDPSMRTALDSLSGLDAPQLDTLFTSFRNRHTSPSEDTYPTALADASWPSLRCLRCDYASFIQLNSVLRPTLTSLTVRGCSARPSVEEWIACLHGLPLLITLDLDDAVEYALGSASLSVPTDRRSPYLSNLRYLSLSDHFDGVAFACLLNHLEIPRDATVHFGAGKMGAKDQFSYVLSVYAEHTPMLRREAPSRGFIVIGYPAARGVHFTFDSNGQSIFADCLDQTSINSRQTTGRSTFTCSRERICEVAMPILSHFSLSQVYGLRCFSILPEEAWKLISQLPNLQELDLEVDIDDGLPGAAAILQCLREPHAFPALRTLRLAGVTWNRRHTNHRKRRARKGSILTLLLEALDARQQGNNPLESVRICRAKNLNVDEDDCEDELEQLGGLAGVDECTMADEDSEEEWDCPTCCSDDSDDDWTTGTEDEYATESDRENGEDD